MVVVATMVGTGGTVVKAGTGQGTRTAAFIGAAGAGIVDGLLRVCEGRAANIKPGSRFGHSGVIPPSWTIRE